MADAILHRVEEVDGVLARRVHVGGVVDEAEAGHPVKQSATVDPRRERCREGRGVFEQDFHACSRGNRDGELKPSHMHLESVLDTELLHLSSGRERVGGNDHDARRSPTAGPLYGLLELSAQLGVAFEEVDNDDERGDRRRAGVLRAPSSRASRRQRECRDRSDRVTGRARILCQAVCVRWPARARRGR